MRERKCCTECSRRRRKVKECKPRGPGRKCWTCQKWNRECSFVHDYPPALKGLVFELSREEKRALEQQRRHDAWLAAAGGGAAGPVPPLQPPGAPSPKRPRVAPRPASHEIAAAAARAALALGPRQAPGGAEAAAEAVPPHYAAEVAILAFAAASAPRAPVPARPPPPPGAPTTSLLISVPDMMCAASCGSAVRGALDALAGTELVGVNIPRKLAHVRTTQDASAILGALRGVGFPGSVVSEAPGDGIEPAAAPVAAEFALADSLGLLVEGCNARTGGPCNCGPSCMCHFCPEHHPERSAKLMEELRRAAAAAPAVAAAVPAVAAAVTVSPPAPAAPPLVAPSPPPAAAPSAPGPVPGA